VWAFNFFFYNKKMKRILYIGVKAVSKTAAEEEKVSGQLFVRFWKAHTQRGMSRGRRPWFALSYK
jgi:hypothetical protein